MNNVKITIAGPTGSGKSTIACLIAQMLEDIKMDVELLDPDYGPEGPMFMLEDKERVDSVIFNSKVVIESVQTGRG